MKQWSDGNEAVEGGGTATLHRGVKGSRGRQGGALCQPWAALQRIQVDPDFNSPSLFVLYIGVRQAITAVERGAWSDGSKALERRRRCNAAEDSKGRPLVNHAIAIQGDKAQLTSCADDLVNRGSPSC